VHKNQLCTIGEIKRKRRSHHGDGLRDICQHGKPRGKGQQVGGTGGKGMENEEIKRGKK